MFSSIVEAVFFYAENTPNKLALVDDSKELTYGKYAELINKYAVILQDLGIKKYDMVLLESEQSVDYLALELAIQLLGATFVPLEQNCGVAKISNIASYINAALVITNQSIPRSRPTISFEYLKTKQASVLITEKFILPKENEVSEILFSTGTTGKEKGIVLTHKNDLSLAQNVSVGVEMNSDNVELIPSPMNHSHGLRRYYANMYMGSTVILLGSVMNINRLLFCIRHYQVTAMDLVPAAMSVVLKLTKGRLSDFSEQLRYIQFGAAPMSEDDKDTVCELLPKTRMYNFYGSTESGCTFIYNFNVPNRKENCIGKPTFNVNAVLTDDTQKVIGSENCNNGLLATQGSMNMLGYWKDADETKKVLRNDTVFSNDIVYFDKDGDAILLGRKSDIINIGGKKVSPDEIEKAAKRMDGITDCACIPVADKVKGQVPKLFVEVKANAQFNPILIRSFLAEHLEPYKVPVYIEKTDKIPRSFNGKILRKNLN